MLCVWICCAGWNPAVDKIGDLLCRILGVIGLVKELSILSGFAGGDLVQVDSLVSKLCQELHRKHNCCDVPCRNQIQFTSMSQLAKPKVVCLLIQQGCHWQFQRITSFNVQLLREGGLTNASRKGQAVDLLVVVVIFILLPMRIEIEAIRSTFIKCSLAAW